MGVGGMTYEEAKKILKSLIPKPVRGDGKSATRFSILWALIMGMDALDFKEKCKEKYRWTPVSEGLPEDGEWAIFTDGKHKSIERCKEDALDHFYPAGRWFELEDAVAWWPLPDEMFDKKEDVNV